MLFTLWHENWRKGEKKLQKWMQICSARTLTNKICGQFVCLWNLASHCDPFGVVLHFYCIPLVDLHHPLVLLGFFGVVFQTFVAFVVDSSARNLPFCFALRPTVAWRQLTNGKTCSSGCTLTRDQRYRTGCYELNWPF